MSDAKKSGKRPGATTQSTSGKTGAGAEAARGSKPGTGSRANPNTTTGRSGESRSGGTINPEGDVESASAGGSAPVDSTTARQHESGYGGRMGQPRTSSDQREPQSIEDTKQVTGSGERATLGDGEAGDGLEVERE
jgi:hypothetical protein